MVLDIYVVISSISRNAGGLFGAVSRLSQSTRKLVNSIAVYAVRDNNSDTDLAAWLPILPRCFDAIGVKSLAYAPALQQSLIDSISANVNILHVHGMWQLHFTVARKAVQKNTKNKLIISPHGMLDPWIVSRNRWKKIPFSFLFENKNLRRADCIHALCESEYQSIRRYGLKNPVAIIPNGIDIPTDDQISATLWDTDMPAGKKVMLFLGRLHPKKGLVNLINAWAKIKSESNVDDWVLFIAGWSQDGHEDVLQQMVKDLQLTGNVLFMGSVYGDKKTAILQRADAFVLPSFSEGLPMSILEAWAYKLPVIMTRECNIDDGFSTGSALEIRPSVDSISLTLKLFISYTDEQRNLIGEKGFSLVQEKYTWPRIAEQMVEVYKWMVGAASLPDCVRLD